MSRFRELLEAAPDAIIEVNGEGRIVLLNGMTEQLFGYSREELLGEPVETLVPDSVRMAHARHRANYACQPTTRAMGIGLALEGRRKDGSCFPIEISLSPVKSADRFGATAIIRDISERKRSDLQLQALQRSHIDQLRALGGALEKAREDERKAVARTIHDELGQALTAIKIELCRLKQELPADRENWLETVDSVLNLVDSTVLSVRRVAANLRPAILDQFGLLAAIEWEAEQFTARTGIVCQLHLQESETEVAPEQATALFRIFLETLTNIVRHANASRVDVWLKRELGSIILEVLDNGRGIMERESSAYGSLGILGMKERALLLGGEFSVHGFSGNGTRVRVRIPVTTQRNRQESSR